MDTGFKASVLKTEGGYLVVFEEDGNTTVKTFNNLRTATEYLEDESSDAVERTIDYYQEIEKSETKEEK